MFLLGFLRALSASLIVLVGTLLVLIAALIPLHIHGASLATWVVVGAARLMLWVFNVRATCSDSNVLRRHAGLVFANHTSYFDVITMMALTPLRFVAAAEYGRSPLWPVMAALGTVFVDRKNKDSRTGVRQRIAEAPRFPPLMIYPEGGIFPDHALNPFRFGAFETAVEYSIPYLLCALRYTHWHTIAWRMDESFISAIWRMACFPGPVAVHLVVIETVQPTPNADAQTLTVSAQRRMAEVLEVEARM